MHIADNIKANAEELARIETTDNGKSQMFAQIDAQNCETIFRYYAGWCEKMHGETYPTEGNFMAYQNKHPLGVVGQIVPWNFPMLMATFKLAPILTTGCTTILKPAENTPLSALKLGEILVDSGVPKGVVNIVPGLGTEAGQALVEHEDVNGIAFTGSTVVGKHIQRTAADTLKNVTLELGGKGANVILDDADMEVAIGAVLGGSFMNNGQYCMASSRVYVQEGIYDAFVGALAGASQTLKVGDGFEADTFNGPLVS